jgi:hypothetical protein
MNITTIENGFSYNNLIYLFNGEIETISDSQCLTPTNEGTILLDLSCTINEIKFLDINEFITALKGE